MGHPTDTTLALYAGGDLGRFQRWQTNRHIAGCERCRAEVEAFQALSAEAEPLGELPDVNWARLSADMKANIRLGLEAGECVASAPVRNLFSAGRAVIACASLAAVVIAAVVLQKPRPVETALVDGVVLEMTDAGIALRSGKQAMTLLHTSVKDQKEVTYSAGAEGALRERYIDADTGSVTINNIYEQ